MKAWKQEIVNDIVTAAADCRIVNLREIANSKGYNHISSQDCRDILHAVTKALPEYKAVRFYKNNPNESLFTTLTFIEKGLEFDDGHPEEV